MLVNCLPSFRASRIQKNEHTNHLRCLSVVSFHVSQFTDVVNRMKTPISLPAFLNRIGSRSWTCSNCQNRWGIWAEASRVSFKRHYGGANKNYKPSSADPRRRRRAIYLAATGAGTGAGAGLFAFTDDIKQGYEAVERTGRVVAALGVCINE